MLYDVPIHTGFKILTHTSSRRFAQNGFNQVGNTTLPANPINPAPVMRSSIYNKNLALRGTGSVRGISEAGYGRRFPYYHLSYAGAGSPRSSLRYPGAGSPRASLRYPGAGSPRTSLRYPGAGSPRTSLSDAYINDNLPPGTLGRIGIPGRRSALRGLSQDVPVAVDTGLTEGPMAPAVDASGGFFSTLQNAITTLATTVVQTTATTGTLAANNAVSNAIAGTPSPQQQIITTVKAATNPKTALGLSVDTLMLIGLGVGAWYLLK